MSGVSYTAGEDSRIKSHAVCKKKYILYPKGSIIVFGIIFRELVWYP